MCPPAPNARVSNSPPPAGNSVHACNRSLDPSLPYPKSGPSLAPASTTLLSQPFAPHSLHTHAPLLTLAPLPPPPFSSLLLPPKQTVACCGFLQCLSMGCGGGQPSAAWRWFTRTGVVTGSDFGDKATCQPYTLAPCAHHVNSTKYPACPSSEYPTPKCTKKCAVAGYKKAYSDDKSKASKSYSLSGVAAIQADIMTKGPVTGAFTVYADFPTYKSGVYKHTSGAQLGGHAIKILGWGVEGGEDYWLVANSWNEQWGDQGYFKIARGTNECGIEGQISAGDA